MIKSSIFAVFILLCSCSSDPYIDRTPTNIFIGDVEVPIQTESGADVESNDGSSLNDHTIFPTVDSGSDSLGAVHCPDSCLNFGTDFNCNQKELDCIAGYQPIWQQFCFQSKKYCSINDWSTWCLQERYLCEGRCTTSCQNCVEANACLVASYECPEACHQE